MNKIQPRTSFDVFEVEKLDPQDDANFFNDDYFCKIQVVFSDRCIGRWFGDAFQQYFACSNQISSLVSIYAINPNYNSADVLELIESCAGISIAEIIREPLPPAVEFFEMKRGKCEAPHYMPYLWKFYDSKMEEIPVTSKQVSAFMRVISYYLAMRLGDMDDKPVSRLDKIEPMAYDFYATDY